MLRKAKESDIDMICRIVNDNWKRVYKGYVNPQLLSDSGCKNRVCELKADILSERLAEYVWEEQNQVVAMLSFGDTEDTDRKGAFEIWRIYVALDFQGKGIGNSLLTFAEQKAKELGYKEIVIWAFKKNVHALSFYQKHGYILDKEEYLSEPYLAMGARLCKKVC